MVSPYGWTVASVMLHTFFKLIKMDFGIWNSIDAPPSISFTNQKVLVVAFQQ